MGGSYYGQLDGDKKVSIIIYSYATDRFMELIADVQSFSDNFSAQVSSEATYGRIDPIKTYSGTTREISFSVLIDSTTQQLNYFNDVVAMSGRMYPVYSETTGNTPYTIKSPPLFAIKVDPILVGGSSITDRANTTRSKMLPGFFTSFGVTYDTTKGVEVGQAKAVPREITLNFSFSPLHDRMGGFKASDNKSNTTGWPF